MATAVLGMNHFDVPVLLSSVGVPDVITASIDL